MGTKPVSHRYPWNTYSCVCVCVCVPFVTRDTHRANSLLPSLPPPNAAPLHLHDVDVDVTSVTVCVSFIQAHKSIR